MITAKFQADFDSFNEAVQKAEVQLRGFESSTKNVGASLSRMADSFSGQKIIAQATLMAKGIESIGGVTKLTSTELQKAGKTAEEAATKFRALGQDVPRDIQKIADAAKNARGATESWTGQLNGLIGTLGVGLSAGAVVGFAKSLLDMGDELVRVADRTGLTTTEVQKLNFIAGQSGNNIDDLTGAIGKLQKNLLTGDQGAVTAVKALGLNLEELKSASPYEQMEQIATAIEKIPDPASRATIAMELFGKGGAVILPTLVSQFKQLGAEAPVMSDKTVRALDAAGDSLAKFGLQIKVVAAESYNFAGQLFDRLTALAYDSASSILKFVAGFLEIEQHIPGVTTAFNKLGISTDGIRRQAQEYSDTASLLVSHLSDQEVAVRNTAKAITDFEPAAKQASEATKAFKYEMVGLGEAGEKFVADFEGRMAKAFAAYYERLEQIIPAQKEWWNLLANPPTFNLPGIETPDNAGAFSDQNKRSADALTRQLGGVIALMPDLGKQAGEEFNAGFGDSLDKLAGIFSRAFEGGGGIGGALKSAGVQAANYFLTPILEGLSKLSKQAVGIGSAVATGIGGAVGGGAGAAVGSLASSFGALAIQAYATHAGLALSATALGAWSLGIGAAAVGVYALAKHFLTVSQAEKDARKAFDDFAKAIGSNGLGDFIQRVSAAGAVMGKNGEDVRKMLEDLEQATHKSPQAVAKALGPLAELIDAADKKTASFAAGLQQMQQTGASAFNAIALAVEGDRGSLEALGAQAVTTFAALVASGASQAQALQAIGPGLDSLVKSYGELGLNIEDAGLSALVMQKRILDGNPAVQAGVDGLTASMDTLAKLGLLNADTFAKMETTGAAMYARLQASAAAAGGTTKDALIPMQTYLHQAEKAAKDLGIPLDDNTQLLIDQSKELGIWKDAGKTANDLMLDGMTALVAKVAELIDQLKSIPTDIHTNVTVTTTHTDGDPGNYAAMGGLVTPSGIQHLAGGGRVLRFPGQPSGMDRVPIWAAAGESVLTKRATATLGPDTIGRLNRGGSLGGGSDPDLRAEIVALREQMATAQRRTDEREALDRKLFPREIARAVRDALAS